MGRLKAIVKKKWNKCQLSRVIRWIWRFCSRKGFAGQCLEDMRQIESIWVRLPQHRWKSTVMQGYMSNSWSECWKQQLLCNRQYKAERVLELIGHQRCLYRHQCHTEVWRVVTVTYQKIQRFRRSVTRREVWRVGGLTSWYGWRKYGCVSDESTDRT